MQRNRSLSKWWRQFIEHLGTFLLSIIMGAIVWLIAIDQENPLVTQQYPEPLAIQVRGLAPQLLLAQHLNPDTLTVVLEAPKKTWATLKASDIQAHLDLTGLRKGVYDLPINVDVANPEVSVQARHPEKLHVQLDDVISKTVAVRVQVMDSAAFGYDWQTPATNPLSVTVQGPSSKVEQVMAADVQVYLRGAKSQVERFDKIAPVDSVGQTVDLLESSPNVVEVVVPVERWPDRKEVAVRVDLVGSPASGYRLDAIKVEPDTVVLRGSSDALDKVPGFVKTQQLTVQNATTDLRAKLKLLLPARVTAFEGDTIDVLVSVVPLEGGDKITLKPVLRGLADGLEAKAALDTVDVILSGPQNQLKSLSSDDVFVILDLNGLLAGTYQLTPDVRVPSGLKLNSVLPATIEVTIKAKATPTPTPVAVSPIITATVVVTPTTQR
jgi:YbbR domain-containing protein